MDSWATPTLHRIISLLSLSPDGESLRHYLNELVGSNIAEGDKIYAFRKLIKHRTTELCTATTSAWWSESPTTFPCIDQSLAKIIGGAMALGLASSAKSLLQSAVTIAQDWITKKTDIWVGAISSLKALTSCIAEFSSSDVSATIERLLRLVLGMHRRTLFKARPSEPKDWKQKSDPSRACSVKNCSTCASLSVFLVSDKQCHTFRLEQDTDGDHLKGRLKQSYFDITMKEENFQCVLTIRKTRKKYESLLSRWKDRLRAAKLELVPLDTEFVRGLLGNSFEELVLLTERPATKPDEAAHQIAAQPSSTIPDSINSSILPALDGLSRKRLLGFAEVDELPQPKRCSAGQSRSILSTF